MQENNIPFEIFKFLVVDSFMEKDLSMNAILLPMKPVFDTSYAEVGTTHCHNNLFNPSHKLP